MRNFLLVSAFISSVSLATNAFAVTPKQCVESTTCDRDESCIVHNCLETGRVSVTIDWSENADLDIYVKTPSGKILSPGTGGQMRADDGRIVIPACYKDDCAGDKRDEEYPHTEHAVWPKIVHPGKYTVWVKNASEVNFGSFDITFIHPDGRRERKLGAVLRAGKTSEEFFFDVLTPECEADTDLDGLCDKWETDGMDINGDGKIDLDLKALGADPNHKDIFVEVDWLKGQKPRSLDLAIAAFKNAPVQNPDGKTGINLHLMMSEEITKIGGKVLEDEYGIDATFLKTAAYDGKDNAVGWFGSKADRADKNSEWISKAREMVYRYAIFAHQYTGYPTRKVLGEADSIPGRGLVITHGYSKSYNNELMTSDTFIHELGHTLGLGHGGRNGLNCKPNYLSTMNYIYDAIAYPRKIDYSSHATPTLNENKLLESEGFNGPKEWTHMFYAVMKDGESVTTTINASSKTVDWDGSGTVDTEPVTADISRVEFCATDAGTLYTLHAQNDWDNLRYDFRSALGSNRFKDDPTPPEEPTEDDKLGFADTVDTDGDGVSNKYDVCRSVVNPDQADRDNDGVGDSCDSCPDNAESWFENGCPDGVVTGTNNQTGTNGSTTGNGNGTNGNGTNGNNSSGKYGSDDADSDLIDTKAGGCSTTPNAPSSFLLFLLISLGFVNIRKKKKA